jgi:hypothetical protein
MSIRASALLLSCVISSSACSNILFDDSCGPTFRTTSVQAELRTTGGDRIGQIILTLGENREDPPTRELSFAVMGPAYANPGPLSGKVTKVRLLGDGLVLRELPFQPGNEHEIIRIQPESLPQAQFDDLRRLAIAGKLALELETSLEGYERVLTPLPLQFAGDWDRAHCS